MKPSPTRILVSVPAVTALLATPALAGSSEQSSDAVFVIFVVILASYFFPAIIAVCRKHHNTLAIFLTNLFFGWTGLGWIGSLIWAATAVRQPIEYRIVHDDRARPQ